MTMVKLGDIASVKGGKRLPKGDALVTAPTPHPYIRTKDINDHTIKTDQMEYVPTDVQKKISRYTVNSGDLIVSIVGTVGSCAIVPANLHGANLTENCAKILMQSKNYNTNFLYYFLRSDIGQVEIFKNTVGSTQLKLPLYGIENIDLPDLEIAQQKAIAHILGTLDDKIELNQKMNETLEDIAKAIFKSWFVDFDPARAKAEGRPTGLPGEINDLFPDAFEDSEIGEIPAGWKNLALNSVFTSSNERVGIGEIREYSSTNEGIQPRDKKYKKNLSSSSSKNKIARKGYFVFGMSREVLNFGLMMDEVGSFSSAYKVYKVEGDVNFSKFIYRQFLASPLYYYQAVSASSREGQSISQETLLGLKILVPTELVLEKFYSIVAPIDARRELLLDENSVLSDLRDLLLPKLISGELRIPDAEKFLEEAGV